MFHKKKRRKWWRIFFEVVWYLEKLFRLQNDLPFLPERMDVEKLEANLDDKTGYFINIRNLKQALNNA